MLHPDIPIDITDIHVTQDSTMTNATKHGTHDYHDFHHKLLHPPTQVAHRFLSSSLDRTAINHELSTAQDQHQYNHIVHEYQDYRRSPEKNMRAPRINSFLVAEHFYRYFNDAKISNDSKVSLGTMRCATTEHIPCDTF